MFAFCKQSRRENYFQLMLFTINCGCFPGVILQLVSSFAAPTGAPITMSCSTSQKKSFRLPVSVSWLGLAFEKGTVPEEEFED